MKPWEHYIEAERLLETMPHSTWPLKEREFQVALAQVHATLALVKSEKTYPVVYTS